MIGTCYHTLSMGYSVYLYNSTNIESLEMRPCDKAVSIFVICLTGYLMTSSLFNILEGQSKCIVNQHITLRVL